MAESVVDAARRKLAELKGAAETPAPAPGLATPTDQELGLDFGRFSGSSSSEEETEESGSEGP